MELRPPAGKCQNCGAELQPLAAGVVDDAARAVDRMAGCAECGTPIRLREYVCKCGQTVDIWQDASYSCPLDRAWHCADCHFGEHPAGGVLSSPA